MQSPIKTFMKRFFLSFNKIYIFNEIFNEIFNKM